MFDREDLSRMRPTEATCRDVSEWPEFHALMRRMGVPTDVDTLHLQITFNGPKDPVEIVQTVRYRAHDKNGTSPTNPTFINHGS